MFGDIFSRGGARLSSIFLGSPEAEAEANDFSRMPLSEVYEDYHNLNAQISAEKYIIVGRKGCGKSAFAEYVTLKAKSSANLFSNFVRKDDYRLDEIVQAAGKTNFPIDPVAFFKWIIYTHIIRLFLQSEAAKDSPKMALIDAFLKKNSGFVDINEFSVREVIEKRGMNVNIEPLRRFLRLTSLKDVEQKQERAPYFQLIPHLEDVIRHILGSAIERQNKNTYILFFDDLDIGYRSGEQSSRDILVGLLRAAKHVNSSVFNGSNAKVVVLLRDDLENDLVNAFPDTAKIFASYAARITWWQDGFIRQMDSENDLHLKSFINKRISYCFEKSSVPFMQGDPWSSMVHFRDARPKDKGSFRKIVDLTLYRPRDLLLFFLPLQEQKFSIPLDERAFESLKRAYSHELMKEVRNEMAASFTEGEIIGIVRALKSIDHQRGCAYEKAVQSLTAEVPGCGPAKAESIILYLYDRSLLGTKDQFNKLRFKVREPAGSIGHNIDPRRTLVVQYGLQDCLRTTRI